MVKTDAPGSTAERTVSCVVVTERQGARRAGDHPWACEHNSQRAARGSGHGASLPSPRLLDVTRPLRSRGERKRWTRLRGTSILSCSGRRPRAPGSAGPYAALALRPSTPRPSSQVRSVLFPVLPLAERTLESPGLCDHLSQVPHHQALLGIPPRPRYRWFCLDDPRRAD